VTSALLTDITIFVLALLVGFEVISKVPATLHTPLMSAANSIHGIILVGAMLIAAAANNAVGYALAFVAAAFAAMNVVGGYVVTGRMLKMFRRRPTPVPAGQAGQTIQAGQATQAVQAAQAAHAGQATPDGQAGQPSQLGGGGTRS
jgi:H+-translocating NAD(P) transhydrogenase subunit alpha